MKRIFTALATLTLATIGMVVPASVASASPVPPPTGCSTCSSVTSAYGQASVEIKWVSKTQVTLIELYVDDTNCDGYGVYPNFDLEDKSGGGILYEDQVREDKNGCHGGGSEWTNLPLSEANGIYKLTIELCKSDGTGCKFGNTLTNPK